jgi:hypothetical protein
MNVYSPAVRMAIVTCPHCARPLGLEAKKYGQVAHTSCVLRTPPKKPILGGMLAVGRGTCHLSRSLEAFR